MDIVVHKELGLVNITLTREELLLAISGLVELYTGPKEAPEAMQAQIREMFIELTASHEELNK